MQFYKYAELIVKSVDVIKLNVIEGNAYIDFLHDRISYDELIAIRKLIACKENILD